MALFSGHVLLFRNFTIFNPLLLSRTENLLKYHKNICIAIALPTMATSCFLLSYNWTGINIKFAIPSQVILTDFHWWYHVQIMIFLILFLYIVPNVSCLNPTPATQWNCHLNSMQPPWMGISVFIFFLHAVSLATVWLYNYFWNTTVQLLLSVLRQKKEQLTNSCFESVFSCCMKALIKIHYCFFLYINDLPSLSSSADTRLIMFADDTTLFKTITNPADISTLQQGINVVCD